MLDKDLRHIQVKLKKATGASKVSPPRSSPPPKATGLRKSITIKPSPREAPNPTFLTNANNESENNYMQAIGKPRLNGLDHNRDSSASPKVVKRYKNKTQEKNDNKLSSNGLNINRVNPKALKEQEANKNLQLLKE